VAACGAGAAATDAGDRVFVHIAPPRTDSALAHIEFLNPISFTEATVRQSIMPIPIIMFSVLARAAGRAAATATGLPRNVHGARLTPGCARRGDYRPGAPGGFQPGGRTLCASFASSCPRQRWRHVRQLVRERGARLGGELVAFGPLDLLQEFSLDRVAGVLLALAQSLAIAPLLLGRGDGHGL
jgi:hypothetical protein